MKGRTLSSMKLSTKYSSFSSSCVIKYPIDQTRHRLCGLFFLHINIVTTLKSLIYFILLHFVCRLDCLSGVNQTFTHSLNSYYCNRIPYFFIGLCLLSSRNTIGFKASHNINARSVSQWNLIARVAMHNNKLHKNSIN